MSISIADAADAIYRFAAGQDRGDRDLYESAFTVHASLDFQQPARLFGSEVPVMVGRDVILDRAFSATADLITTHSVTNVRWVDEAADSVHALVEAQHVRPAEPEQHFLLKNNYFVDLVAEAPGARIRRLVIETLWSNGDPHVLFDLGD